MQRFQLRVGRYVEVISPGVQRGIEFIGDGEYCFRDGAFKPVSS